MVTAIACCFVDTVEDFATPYYTTAQRVRHAAIAVVCAILLAPANPLNKSIYRTICKIADSRPLAPAGTLTA